MSRVSSTADAPAALFDDDYARVLAPFHGEEEARWETAALREMLALAQDDRILDLGCGWGRHLGLLRDAGHDVVGLDLSLPLLRRARAGEGAAPRVAGDMQALPFRDGAFDVVLNLATSLGLFLDDAPAIRVLAGVRHVLAPGGRLLLEGMHRDDVVAHYAARDAWVLEDGTRVRARRRLDALAGVSHEVLRWAGPAGSGSKRHALRLRSATEMRRLLREAGLRVVTAYGGWDGAPFGRASGRLIVVARPG